MPQPHFGGKGLGWTETAAAVSNPSGFFSSEGRAKKPPIKERGAVAISHSLNHQFKMEILKCYKKNMDKHAIKKENGLGSYKIYSTSDCNNLIDLAKNLSEFIKTNYPQVKLVKQIFKVHCRAFLESKAETCSQDTLNQYAARLRKLAKILYHTLGVHVDFSCNAPVSKVSDEYRHIPMRRENLNKILNSDRDCQSKTALRLSAETALRITSLVKLRVCDVDFEKKSLHIYKDKGGRSRDIELTETALTILRDCCRDNNPSDYLFPGRQGNSHLSANSVNRFLNENALKCGITQYADAKTGNYSIRKMAAQEYLARLVYERDIPLNKAVHMTMIFLGHSSDRPKLREIYLKEFLEDYMKTHPQESNQLPKNGRRS